MISVRFFPRLAPIAFVFFIAACGVKSAPKPPSGGEPPRVDSLQIWSIENVITLAWQVKRPEAVSKFLQPVKYDIQRRTRKANQEIWTDYALVDSLDVASAEKEIEWRDDNVKPETYYEYRVAGVDENGRRGAFSKAMASRWDTPPDRPENLAAKPGDRSVNLTWKAPSSGPEPEGYLIYRATGNKNFRQVFRLPVITEEFFDAALENGKTYKYYVRAMRTAGTYIVEGAASEIVEVTPTDAIVPQVPIGVGSFFVDNAIQVVWWPIDDENLAGYNVYRSAGGKAVKLTETPIKDAIYIDKDITRGKRYTYYVTAVDSAGNESPQSEPANVFAK